jgi:PAS domain S-box-containing protein
MASLELETMSKEALIRELQKLREIDARRGSAREHDPVWLNHELQVHQVELEMQNRELREAQQHLEYSRDRYASLYDFAPIGYCTLDTRGIVREANLTAELLLGSPRDRLIGRSLSSLVSTDMDQLREHLRRCAAENGRVTTDLTWSTARHGTVEAQLVSTSMTTDTGEVWFRTALLDVTTLRESERRLRFLSDAGDSLARSFDYQAALSEVMRLAVPLLSDLCVLDVMDDNETMQRMEVCFADAVKQAQLAESLKCFAPQVDWHTPEANVVASGQPFLVREITAEMTETLAHDGEHARLLAQIGLRSLMVVPLVARGHTLGVLSFATAESGRTYAANDFAFAESVAQRVAIALDNSRLYLQAQRAVQARDAVLAVVSHDLRNPLTTIMMSAAELVDRPVALERRTEARRSTDAIRHAAHAMNRLIGDLVDIVSLEAGHLAMNRRDVSSSALLADTLEMMRPLADKARVVLTVEAPADDATVRCDRERIIQVLSNIVANAIKFTSAGGAVKLRGAWQGDEVAFVVSDNGPGIPEQELPHVFDRFWQSTKTAHLGLGLGLSIAKGIAEAHGGRIHAESGVGVGSTFLLSLPRVPAQSG